MNCKCRFDVFVGTNMMGVGRGKKTAQVVQFIALNQSLVTYPRTMLRKCTPRNLLSPNHEMTLCREKKHRLQISHFASMLFWWFVQGVGFAPDSYWMWLLMRCSLWSKPDWPVGHVWPTSGQCGPGFHWWPYPSPWVSLSSIVGSSSLALELWEVYSIPRYSNPHCCIAESKLEKTWSPNGAKNYCTVCTHIQSNQDKVALKF